MQHTPTRSNQPRVALYSHDGEGLGHVRRNLLIARALAGRGAHPVILLLSGLHESNWFDLPDGVDCVTLPAITKTDDGTYRSRSLGLPLEDVIDLRRQTIDAALRSFDPDLLVVDKLPGGAFGELQPSLESLRRRGRTRIVLGLREILDAPAAVANEWVAERFQETVRRYYQRMWVYGDRRVYDLVRQYDVPADLAELTRFTGYLDPLDPALPASNGAEGESEIDDLDFDRARLALCVVGGGRDGVALAEAFVRAELPRDMAGLLITGPLMPADARAHLERLVERTPSRRLLPFVTDPIPFVRRADRLVAMGGYNTMCEIVPRGVPTLVVPRVRPRTEQLLRARRFEHLGFVECLHPDRLSPQAVTEWLAREPRSAPHREDVDFGGIARLPRLMNEVFHAIDADRCNLAG